MKKLDTNPTLNYDKEVKQKIYDILKNNYMTKQKYM